MLYLLFTPTRHTNPSLLPAPLSKPT